MSFKKFKLSSDKKKKVTLYRKGLTVAKTKQYQPGTSSRTQKNLKDKRKKDTENPNVKGVRYIVKTDAKENSGLKISTNAKKKKMLDVNKYTKLICLM